MDLIELERRGGEQRPRSPRRQQRQKSPPPPSSYIQLKIETLMPTQQQQQQHFATVTLMSVVPRVVALERIVSQLTRLVEKVLVVNQ